MSTDYARPVADLAAAVRHAERARAAERRARRAGHARAAELAEGRAALATEATRHALAAVARLKPTPEGARVAAELAARAGVTTWPGNA